LPALFIAEEKKKIGNRNYQIKGASLGHDATWRNVNISKTQRNFEPKIYQMFKWNCINLLNKSVLSPGRFQIFGVCTFDVII